MDTNPVSVGHAFLEILKVQFPNFIPGLAPTHLENLIAKKLLKSFYQILDEYVAQEDEEFYEPELGSPGSSYSQDQLKDDDGYKILKEKTECSIERKREILKLIEKHPGWALSTIQRKDCAPEFKQWNYQKRWTAHVESGGTLFEKYSFIDTYVYSNYAEARKEYRAVRAIHLRRWALQGAQTFKDPGFRFRASLSWLNDFKTRHHISSRKITKLVSRRHVKSFEAILESAQKFKCDFANAAQGFPAERILNTDQVGFVYEIVPSRTLSTKGEKSTLAVVKSPTNLATHSYTVQYVLNKAGDIVGDVFICLQERSGRLGPKVQENLFPAPNVDVTCSTSGKLTTLLIEYFLDNVLMKVMEEDFLLLLDSWSGQTKTAIYEDRFGVDGSPNCTLKIIPEKCTSTCQPLDTTFHLQLKYFARIIYAEAGLEDPEYLNPEDEVTTRNNIMRLHSLLHNQFKADIFKPMIQYSWHSAGLSEDSPLFDSVPEACFTFEPNDPISCANNGCNTARFLLQKSLVF